MDDIYKEQLMDIYKNPANRGNLPNPDVAVTEKNPLCGDEVNLQLEIEDNQIKDAKFKGSACAVSVLSSEMLIDSVLGKSVAEVKKMTKDDLLKIIGLNLTTSRVKCATLSLTALQKALESYDKNNKHTK